MNDVKGAVALEGVLVVDKPAGPTSHDVVVLVRKVLRTQRVGHLGTLDPAATGVLPLVLGRATRLARFLGATRKTYEATIALGRVTDTYDATGRELPPPPGAEDLLACLTPARIARALDGFRGPHRQIPPPFSAKHVDGERAYRRARRQEDVRPAAVDVTTDAVELLDHSGTTLRVRLVVSPGFYVRAFAHELGRTLGCGALLACLRRTAVGEFDLQRAVMLNAPPERLAERLAAGIVPIDSLLGELPACRVTETGWRRARHGQDIRDEDRRAEPPSASRGRATGGTVRFVRILSPQGGLVGIAEPVEGAIGALHPVVVLG